MEVARPSSSLSPYSCWYRTWGLGTLPVLDGDPRREHPLSRAGTPGLGERRGTSVHSERGQGFPYLPSSTEKLLRAVLKTGLQWSEKGHPGPCGAAAGGLGQGRAVPAVPSELPT